MRRNRKVEMRRSPRDVASRLSGLMSRWTQLLVFDVGEPVAALLDAVRPLLDEIETACRSTAIAAAGRKYSTRSSGVPSFRSRKRS